MTLKFNFMDLMELPLLGNIGRTRIVVDRELDTTATCELIEPKFAVIKYNPDLMSDNSQAERQTILEHELMHARAMILLTGDKQ